MRLQTLLCLLASLQLGHCVVAGNGTRVHFYIGSDNSQACENSEALKESRPAEVPGCTRPDSTSAAGSIHKSKQFLHKQLANTVQKKQQQSEAAAIASANAELQSAVRQHLRLETETAADNWTLLGYRLSHETQQPHSMYVRFRTKEQDIFCKFISNIREYQHEARVLRIIHETAINCTYAPVATFKTGVSALPYAIMTRVIEQPNLLDYLVRPDDVSYADFVHVMRNLADAIHTIHRCRIVHCDIKLENVLVHRETLAVYLVDFGHACHVENLSDRMKGPCGTAYSAAPETVPAHGCTFTSKCDWYSYGACLFYGHLLVTRHTRRVMYHEYPLNEENVHRLILNDDLATLIIRLIRPEAERLSDYSEIVAAPIFSVASQRHKIIVSTF